MIVLDASLVIEWLLGDQNLPSSPDLPQLLGDNRLLVPCHWPVEVANVLRTQMLSKKLTPTGLTEVLVRLDELDINIEPPASLDEIGPLAVFSHLNNLTGYDGAYVQLAYQRGLPLATLDNAMRRAAATLRVSLLPA